MQAAWDWALPRETPAEQRALVAFAADCGFDTLVVADPTPAMAERGADRGVRIVATVTPDPDKAFREEHPACRQRLHPAEAAANDALADAPADYLRLAGRGYPLFHDREFVCFARSESERFLRERVREALAVADGVALDGFGFRNGYACFCERCRERRADRVEASGDPLPQVIARDGRELLVETSETLYDAATDADPDALVVNHVWPPFRPDPGYGRDLRLDYRSETVAWFYRPHRGLDRVDEAAAALARRERPARNRVVPFVGTVDESYQRRSANRLAAEVDIALERGDGNVVFCTLERPYGDEAVADALRERLTRP